MPYSRPSHDHRNVNAFDHLLPNVPRRDQLSLPLINYTWYGSYGSTIQSIDQQLLTMTGYILHVRMPYMHPGIYVHLVLCVTLLA